MQTQLVTLGLPPAPLPVDTAIATLRRNLRRLIQAYRDAGEMSVTQTALAAAAGYKHVSSLNGFLNSQSDDERLIGLERLEPVAKILRVSVSDLFDPRLDAARVVSLHENARNFTNDPPWQASEQLSSSHKKALSETGEDPDVAAGSPQASARRQQSHSDRAVLLAARNDLTTAIDILAATRDDIHRQLASDLAIETPDRTGRPKPKHRRRAGRIR
jgi:hypothetical protein